MDIMEQIAIPNLFIVGAPKSGTTALYEYLRQHPQIYFPKQKEFYFFCTDFSFKLVPISSEEYLSHFMPGRGFRWRGEATPYYLLSGDAPHRIHAMCPEARVIIILRNPVDMMYSLHSQLLYTGAETVSSFEEALALEPKRKLGQDIPYTAAFSERLLYRSIADYPRQLQRYMEVFDTNQILVLVYEELFQDIHRYYDYILSFLGLTSTGQTSFSVVNPNKTARFPVLSRVVNHHLLRNCAKRTLPSGVRNFLYKRIMRANASYTQRTPMPEHLRASLLEETAPITDEMEILLGRELPSWRK
ncbi:MAG: sulfotransferase family protein [Candidatus Hydrogenedentota bacterium]